MSTTPLGGRALAPVRVGRKHINAAHEWRVWLLGAAIVVIVVLMLLGPTVSAIFQSVNDNL
jgi:hypothetical protein